MNITLTPEQEAWVKQQLDAGHFATAEDAIAFAINEAKRSDLRATLTASIARGGSHSADEVRGHIRSVLDEHKAS
jgi:Arc/MetJ-type ribon-helix-helix transcriptional regulator